MLLITSHRRGGLQQPSVVTDGCYAKPAESRLKIAVLDLYSPLGGEILDITAVQASIQRYIWFSSIILNNDILDGKTYGYHSSST